MSVTPALEALAAAGALRTAAQLRVMDRLRATPLDARGLAIEFGLSQRGTRILLAALAALGVVEPTAEGRYQATPTADLVASAAQLYDGLPDAIRAGTSVQAWDQRSVAAGVYPGIVPMLADMFQPAAERAADVLASPGQRILDVAAGAAPWSLALAARDSTSEVTALDLPDVLPQTRRAVKQRGLEDQYRFLAGDAFTGDLGGPYDLTVVANFCHLFGSDANLRLLRRLRAVLDADGRVAIVDVMPAAGRDTLPQLALYELSLLLRTNEGAAHPFTAHIDWLTECDYRGIQRVELDPAAQMTLVVATLH